MKEQHIHQEVRQFGDGPPSVTGGPTVYSSFGGLESAPEDEFTGSTGGAWSTRIGAVCRSCVRQLAVDGAAVTIRGGGTNEELLHATDRVITGLIDLEFVIGEGPRHDTHRTAQMVLEPTLAGPAAQLRWPGFSREAVAAGAGAVFVFPLRIGPSIIGALSLYRHQPGDLSIENVATARSLANTALDHIVHDLLGVGVLAQDGLRLGREVISQATGMIAVQREIALDEAQVLLRAAAYAQNRPITELADDVIHHRVAFSHPG